jgi:regulator of protease activity HflC (stomatin/prohibitin superfamily)
MHPEKTIHVNSGWPMLVLNLAGLVGGTVLLIATAVAESGPAGPLFGLFIIISAIVSLAGHFTLQPNQARVLILFGDYRGTVRESGFYWTNPFYTKRLLSLRLRNLEGDKLKVNDKQGNPIEIAAVVVWRVENTAQACFDVENFEHYVKIQSESAMRHLANSYAYDRRQQAEAIIAARKMIVHGAVSMVQMALDELATKQIVEFDEERKAAMVSNLLVVLCGEHDAQPVINTGTLYT